MNLFMRTMVLLLVITLALGANAPAPAPAPAREFEAVGEPHLHNAHVVTDKLISGAQPEGEAAFELLAKLGVKTIISVDGAKPDVEMARRHGMRYVHLPIGYDGVDNAEGKAIAKAIEELPGKIYIHCHHGKHRSAAALAVACVMNGSLKPNQAESVLRTFGTGANYTGLWRAARQVKPLEPSELNNIKVDYVEVAQMSDIVESMVAIDKRLEHLKQMQANGWRPPADHPDLAPAHEALMLQEHLHESMRVDDDARPERFAELMKQSETAAQSLRDVLAAQPVDPKAADVRMKAVTTSCTSCHQSYRD